MRWIVVLCLLLPLAACEPSRVPHQLNIGIAIPSYVHAVVWIAAEKGFFRKRGVPSTVQVLGGSAATMRALISNNIDIGVAGGDAVLKANRAGADLVVIAGLVNRFYHRLIVRREIRTAADLRGRSIGLPFLGGPQDMAVRYALKQFNLAYGSDVKVLSLGKEFNRIAALSRGDIQGTTSQTPIAQLAPLGLHVIADLPAWDVHFPYAMVVVRRADLHARAQDIRHFLTGLCEGIQFYQLPRHKTEALSIIARHMGQSDTTGAAEARYASAGPSLIAWPPIPEMSGFEQILNLLKLDRTALQAVDLSLLKQLQHEGTCG